MSTNPLHLDLSALEPWGWTSDLSARLARLPPVRSDGPLTDEPVTDGPLTDGSLIPARVVSLSREIYRVQTPGGERIARPAGSLRAESDLPAVGDWVLCRSDGADGPHDEVDNPGVREIQLWSGEESLGEAFDDIEGLATSCRFRDCRHEDEPDCAVIRAVEEGDLSADRLESYRGLQRELRHLELKRDVVARRRESKKTGQLYKRIQSAKRRQKGR